MAHTLCTRDEIVTMVHNFYGRIRQDALLGPIFNTHITDWDTHLATMVEFWSSLLLGTASFQGRPMPKHAALPSLSAPLFHHWLALFKDTTNNLGNDALAQRAQEFSRRIARQLWLGYQISNTPSKQPEDLFAPHNMPATTEPSPS